MVPKDPTAYEEGLSWSPDGRFILARAAGGLHLIDVRQGTATPLTFGGALWEPSWRPRSWGRQQRADGPNHRSPQPHKRLKLTARED